MHEVRKKFLPRFIGLARERIRLGREIASRAKEPRDAAESRDRARESQPLDYVDALHIARELHSLAGEAGLLGLGELLALARRAEEEATKLHASRTEARRLALEQALLDLHLAVGAVEQQLEDAG